jgi:hypothetical protein
MKIGLVNLVNTINALDPAQDKHKLVHSVRLITHAGFRFQSNDLHADNVMVMARHAEETDTWFYAATEDLAGIEVAINREACEKAKIDPTLPAVMQKLLPPPPKPKKAAET